MSATGQPNSSPTKRKNYAVGSAADTTWVAPGAMADWVKVVGIGSTVLLDESGASVTVTTDAAEPSAVLPGPWSGFVSTTATRVTMGNGGMMPRLALGTVPTIAVGSGGPYAAIAVANQATLTGLAQTVDGVALSTAGMRVYLANQTTPTQNGGWVVAAGAWTRPADWTSGATIALGTVIWIAPGGTANWQAFGAQWYVDSASGVVDTGTIVAYPLKNKGVGTLVSGSPSTVTISNLWIKSTTTSAVSVDNTTTAANGVKGALTAGAGTGTLVITGPNTVTDVISYLVVNA